MKRKLSITVAIFGIVFALNAAAAAQIGAKYRGDIPFAFSANDVEFPAGEYLVGPLSDRANQGAVLLSSRDTGRERIIGMGHFGNDLEKTAKIRFVLINGRYHLAGIDTPTLVMRTRRTWTDVREVAGGELKEVAVKLTKF